MTDACAWNLNAFCFISRDVFLALSVHGGARFFLGTFPGTGTTGTRSSHRDLQNDVP